MRWVIGLYGCSFLLLFVNGFINVHLMVWDDYTYQQTQSIKALDAHVRDRQIQLWHHKRLDQLELRADHYVPLHQKRAIVIP